MALAFSVPRNNPAVPNNKLLRKKSLRCMVGFLFVMVICQTKAGMEVAKKSNTGP
jgi:hypothetical protein